MRGYIPTVETVVLFVADGQTLRLATWRWTDDSVDVIGIVVVRGVVSVVVGGVERSDSIIRLHCNHNEVLNDNRQESHSYVCMYIVHVVYMYSKCTVHNYKMYSTCTYTRT